MRRLKKGFTLAEVLITLGIIGVVAAIVMPSVITSYQYKTIGVKLSKFASQTENTARPFVVQNDSFRLDDSNGLTQAFLEDSFIISDIFGQVPQIDDNGNPVMDNQGNPQSDAIDTPAVITTPPATITQTSLPATDEAAAANAVYKLKDGTAMRMYRAGADGATDSDSYLLEDGNITVDFEKVGRAAIVVEFDPVVTGLPNAVQKTFTFVITELGYVYPSAIDECLEAIYLADFATNARLFSEDVNPACTVGNQ